VREVGRVEGEHTIVDRVVSEYTITFGRYERNAAKGFSVARADVPRGKKADAERLAAVVKAITGKEPRIIEKNDGTIETVYGSAHLKSFMRYAELADAIARWLEETGRRQMRPSGWPIGIYRVSVLTSFFICRLS
jgi:hypothetical protein